MLSIREIDPADTPSAQALFERCFPETIGDTLWRRASADPARVTVAVESHGNDTGQVVGLASLRQVDDQIAVLSHLGVDLSARDRGIGSLLLADAWTEAKRLGVNWLLSEVEWPQEAAGSDWAGDPLRRWQFFDARGGVLVSDRYATPLPDGGAKDVMLLGFPLRRQAGVSEVAAVADWASALWGPGGHGIPAEDPRTGWLSDRILHNPS